MLSIKYVNYTIQIDVFDTSLTLYCQVQRHEKLKENIKKSIVEEQ